MRVALSLLILAAAGCAASNDTGPVTARASVATPTAGEMIIARQAGMNMMATLLFRNVKRAVASGADVKQEAHEGEGIALFAAAIPGLFTQGSGVGETRATAAIWANKPDFNAKAKALESAGDRLAAAAHAGDTAAFAREAAAVEQACSACHTVYRAD